MAAGKQKSMLLAVLLTLIFGPFGMFYSTVIGALIMLVVTAGLGFGIHFGFFFTWPICLIWTVVAVNKFNRG